MDCPDIHVLAVDDSLLDRKVVERLLKSSSYKVTTVDSALRALEVLGIVGTSPLVLNAFKINLIITDYCMPEMTGYDLLKKVKESSALKEIPVVIMSSENVPSRINMCLAEGAKEFIIKPLQVADVKRLRGHIKEDDFAETPTSPCTKRKVLADSGASLCVNKRHATSVRLRRVVSPGKEDTRVVLEKTVKLNGCQKDAVSPSKEDTRVVLEKTVKLNGCQKDAVSPSKEDTRVVLEKSVKLNGCQKDAVSPSKEDITVLEKSVKLSGCQKDVVSASKVEARVKLVEASFSVAVATSAEKKVDSTFKPPSEDLQQTNKAV